MAPLMPSLELLQRRILDERAEALFTALDTDGNGLIDALEFLGTVAMLSGMDLRHKVNFTFNMYDFDESGALTVDEVTLLLKSTLVGLTKLSVGIAAAPESELELIAFKMFDRCGKDSYNVEDKLTLEEFQECVLKMPDIRSWIRFYDNPPASPPVEDLKDSDVEAEAANAARTRWEAGAMDPDSGRFSNGSVEVEEEEDESFSAVKPWIGTVENTVPSNPPPLDNSVPGTVLKLEWAHGYSCAHSRGNVFYTFTGDVLYPAASFGILFNVTNHTQRHFMDNTDEVVSLALHPGGYFVATGERGRFPKVCVWNAQDCKLVAVIRGFHKRAVTSLAWSPDGRRLVTVGQDENHSVALYSWPSVNMEDKPVCSFTERAGRNKVLDVCFYAPDKFVTVGVKHVVFWRGTTGTGMSGSGASWSAKTGLFGRKGAVQTMLCAAGVSGKVVTGSVSGHFYIWEGRNLKRSIKVHDGPVNCLCPFPEGLISGGKDGKVKMWTLRLDPGAQFDVEGLGCNNPCVRSVTIDDAGQKVLLGTRGGEIFEISAADGSNLHAGPIVSGHCSGQLWGLAVHPGKAEFCTVGDDKSLRIWDVTTRRMLRMVMLDTSARAVAYSSEGDNILVGYGAGGSHGKKKQKKEGGFAVINEVDLTIVYEGRDSKKTISDVKFSPDGETIAIGSFDHAIYMYDSNDYSSKGKCRRFSSRVTHFDFSADSQWLQANSGAYELLFFSAQDGTQNNSAAAMRDVDWATFTCTLGWPVQGLWPPQADGTEVLAADRSKQRDVIAAVDNFGKLRIYRYPCVTRGAAADEYHAHATNVTNVRFTFDDAHLITTGGDDCTVLQWRFTRDDEDSAKEDDGDVDSDDAADLADGTVVDRHPKQEAANQIDTSLEFMMEDKADEFAAVKPWIGVICAPSQVPDEDLTTPNHELVLEWIHGYQCEHGNNNLRYTSSGKIVYPAAGVNIVLDHRAWVQSFHQDHTDDIVCLAMHPDGVLCATGQIGRTPKICIWNTETQKTVQQLSGFHTRAVSALAFSQDGRYLASAGQDNDHTIAIFDWALGATRSFAVGDANKVTALGFSPSGQLVSCGQRHIKFWRLTGCNLTSKRAMVGKKGKLQHFTCLAFVGDDALIGTADGHIYRFSGFTLDTAISAHEKNVAALSVTGEGICSGGKDGVVKLWNNDLDCIAEFMMAACGSLEPRVRSVHWVAEEEKILVGTRGSEIFEISAVDGTNLHDGPLVQGHYKHELWAIAVHPIRQEVCTVGDDKTIRIWDVMTMKMLRMKQIDTFARAVTYSVDGDYIAVGLGGSVGRGKQRKDGYFHIYNNLDLELEHELRDSKQWITDVKYSPDGNSLAVASRDNYIYLYDVPSDYAKRAMFTGHNSYITHMDWSVDSQYIRSNCGAFELLYSDSTTAVQVQSAASLRDVEWATQTCPLDWSVKGIWSSGVEGVSTITRVHDHKVVAFGDNFGKIKMAHWPVPSTDTALKSYRGHTSRVATAKFTQNGSHLLTVGVRDRCFMQWRHEEDKEPDTAPFAGDSGDDSDIALENALESDDEAGEGDGDQFMSVKPFTASLVPPSNAPNEDLSSPRCELRLQHVHGYRAQDVRGNLWYSASGKIVYCVANIGVLYDSTSHSQQHYIEHDDEIISLAVSPDGRFVATGQKGARPRVHVWDAMAASAVCVLPAFHRRGVSSLAFSGDGKQLVSVGSDQHHSVALWRSRDGEWADGEMQANISGHTKKTLFIQFTGVAPYHVVLGGVEFVRFLRIYANQIKATAGIFGSKGKIQPVLCAGHAGAQVVTGTASGHLYVWEQRTVSRSVRAHSGAVTCMHTTSEGIVTGGKDGHVKTWGQNLQPLQAFELINATWQPYDPCVRSVCWNIQENKILVGTKGSEIYEVSTESGDMLQVAQGHCEGECWGLAMHPTNPDIFATVGDDKSLRIWSVKQKRLLHKAVLDTGARAVAWSPDGSMIAVGLGGAAGRANQRKAGAFMILSAQNMDIVHEARESRQWIRDIKFSDDGKRLGIASEDNKIYLHDVEDAYRHTASCRKSNSFVSHFDFSEDSQYIQSNTGDYELIFYNVGDGAQISAPSALKDVAWQTWTCPLGWPVQGIWPAEGKEATVNAVHRANVKPALATVDEGGVLKVFRYPTLVKGSNFVLGKGHSGHVTNVRFNKDDTRIVTVGGSDCAIMQWEFVMATREEGGP